MMIMIFWKKGGKKQNQEPLSNVILTGSCQDVNAETSTHWYMVSNPVQYTIYRLGKLSHVFLSFINVCLFTKDQICPPVSKCSSEGVEDKLYGGLGGQQKSYFGVKFIKLSTCSRAVWIRVLVGPGGIIELSVWVWRCKYGAPPPW